MRTTFYFDPACPWTWRASRWLVMAAQARGLTVRWRPFSLAILSGGEVPAERRVAVAASARALRLVAALAEADLDGQIARFYTELGTRVHDGGEDLTDAVVNRAADAAGVADALVMLNNPAWDDAVRASHAAAYESAGPDIGSPVLHVSGARRGLHGPILASLPSAEESALLWDVLLPLLRSETFLEVKRGRR